MPVTMAFVSRYINVYVPNTKNILPLFIVISFNGGTFKYSFLFIFAHIRIILRVVLL
jgi:hypothetical protein